MGLPPYVAVWAAPPGLLQGFLLFQIFPEETVFCSCSSFGVFESFFFFNKLRFTDFNSFSQSPAHPSGIWFDWLLARTDLEGEKTKSQWFCVREAGSGQVVELLASLVVTTLASSGFCYLLCWLLKSCVCWKVSAQVEFVLTNMMKMHCRDTCGQGALMVRVSEWWVDF